MWRGHPSATKKGAQYQTARFFYVICSVFPSARRKIMSIPQPNNALHGITLEQILVRLVENYGWEELGRRIAIRCFLSDPSIKSSLKFLRKTDWARKKVEELYLGMPE
jgi:uncharacterized protein (DUF2132 family)